jgi:hypothetical protein
MKINIANYRHRVVVLVCLFLALCTLIISPWAPNVKAAPVNTTISSKGLTFSPLRSEFDVASGTSHEGILRVSNLTDKPMSIHLSAEAFSVINQRYDYAFSAESDVAKWVSFVPQDIDLMAGESKNATYAVGVPLTAEPGGRYISLFASTDTATSSEGVKSRQRVASLIYLTVLGDVSRVGRLVSLSSPWAISGSSQWSAALQNTGTTHFRSRYEVRVQYLIGSGVAASAAGDALVLPGTVRAVTDTLPVPSWPGIYEVVYRIGLGDTPAKIEKRLMLYLPPVAIAGVLVALSAVGLVILLRRKH